MTAATINPSRAVRPSLSGRASPAAESGSRLSAIRRAAKRAQRTNRTAVARIRLAPAIGIPRCTIAASTSGGTTTTNARTGISSVKSRSSMRGFHLTAFIRPPPRGGHRLDRFRSSLGLLAGRGGRRRWSWNGARSRRHVGQHANVGDPVFGVPEATGRQTFLLLIVERDAPADRLVDLLRHALVPDGESEFLGNGARHRHHRHFPFPGLA